MAIEARRRHQLYDHARASWGEPAADTLMDLLPPDPSALATKQDLAVTTAELRTGMAELRTELRTGMAELRTELRTEMAELRTELRTEMAELRTELRTEMAELRAEFHQALAEQTRTLFLGAVGAILTSTALSFAAAHVG